MIATNHNDGCKTIRGRFQASRALRAQRHIARRVLLRDEYGPIRVVVGLDAAYYRGRNGEGQVGVGVAVALRYPSLKPVGCVAVLRRVCIPYVPGLLAFREMAVLAPALLKLALSIRPDLVVVDGHGIAHPRRAGIASHIGVVFNIPSIGVAKKRLYGSETELGELKVLVNLDGVPIAALLRRGRSKIYVSPGHRITLESSIKLINTMWRRGKLPEPTKVADRISKEIRERANQYPLHSGIVGIRC